MGNLRLSADSDGGFLNISRAPYVRQQTSDAGCTEGASKEPL